MNSGFACACRAGVGGAVAAVLLCVSGLEVVDFFAPFFW